MIYLAIIAIILIAVPFCAMAWAASNDNADGYFDTVKLSREVEIGEKRMEDLTKNELFALRGPKMLIGFGAGAIWQPSFSLYCLVNGEMARRTTTSLRNITDEELQVRLNAYPGMSWLNTPEHAEMTRRQWRSRGYAEATDEVENRV